MTKQEELLNGVTDTNIAVKQLSESINAFIVAQKVNQEPERQRIGFVQKVADSIVQNPKTSLAGLGVAISQIIKAIAPQYADICDMAFTGLASGGLIVSHDAKPSKAVIKPIDTEEVG